MTKVICAPGCTKGEERLCLHRRQLRGLSKDFAAPISLPLQISSAPCYLSLQLNSHSISSENCSCKWCNRSQGVLTSSTPRSELRVGNLSIPLEEDFRTRWRALRTHRTEALRLASHGRPSSRIKTQVEVRADLSALEVDVKNVRIDFRRISGILN